MCQFFFRQSRQMCHYMSSFVSGYSIPELLLFDVDSTYSYNAFGTLKLHQTSNLLYYKINFGIYSFLICVIQDS